jgi:hypothetical protein
MPIQVHAYVARRVNRAAMQTGVLAAAASSYFFDSVPDPLKLPDNLFRIELIGLSALVAILRSKLVHGFERRPTT